MKKIRVALAGLRFGGAFAPSYRSIVEERKPWIDERRAARGTAAGVCAHQSAVKGGKRVEVPAFD
jgi:hypothetical protein